MLLSTGICPRCRSKSVVVCIGWNHLLLNPTLILALQRVCTVAALEIPSGPSPFIDDMALHSEDPGAIPDMCVMVNAGAAYNSLSIFRVYDFQKSIYSTGIFFLADDERSLAGQTEPAQAFENWGPRMPYCHRALNS